MNSKHLLIILLTLVLCFALFIPLSFAYDNTVDANNDLLSATDYYYDINNTEEGNGSLENPYNNLNDSNLLDNSIIHLAEGEYNLESDRSFSEISFLGAGVNKTLLNANGYRLTNTNILNFENITVINITISNLGTLNASNMVFKNSQGQYGSVINSDSNKEVYLNNCEFYNNSASYGGVIYIFEGNLEINNTIFENNTASVFGGAITSVKSNLRIFNLTSRNNNAKYNGGLIYSLYGNFSIINSTLTNNTSGSGGALFIDNNTDAVFINNTFRNNTATIIAGALYSLTNLNLSFENNDFYDSSQNFNDFINASKPILFVGNGNYTMLMYNSSYTGDLPSNYSLVDDNFVTPVKNQGSGGNCWSFAAIGALESCILKATGLSYDLSEENMKNLMALYSDYGWNYTTNTGGVDDMGVGYLASWLGAVNESEDEYNPKFILSPVLNSFIHIQNILFLTRNSYTDNDAIKKAILEYGGVTTAIKWSGSSIKGNSRYYDGNDNSDHAVVIVGWDDNYSKDNFDKTPEGDGAWIIKNSHGESSGDKGYWYVSYYDRRCAQVGRSDVSYTFILNDTLKFDKNYQYDFSGRTDFFINSSSTVWYKNKFISTENEYLAAVSTHFQKNTNYTLYVNVNNQLRLIQSGVSPIGYFTIPLSEIIQLSEGDVFEVIFKISVEGDAGFPISEIVSLNKLLYSENTSFVSYDGETWSDLFNLTWAYSSHTYKSQVACIKAFTYYDLVNTSINLSFNISDTFKIQARVLNIYGYGVNGGEVIFAINNENYTVNVSDGTATLTLTPDIGEYNVTAVYNASGYISSKDNLTIGISSINTSISLNISNTFSPVEITAHVLNQYGYAVSFGSVTFFLDNVNYTVNVINGKVYINHTFKNLGLNNVRATYNDLYYYKSSNVTGSVYVNSTIISADSVNVLNSYYSFKLLDNYGNPLINKSLTVNINSKDYNLESDEDGEVFLKINLNVGKYIIKITNPFSSEIKTQNINVIARIIENTHVKMYYGANKYYKVRVRDDDNSFKSNLKVTFTINGRNYYAYTDNNGYASFKISLKPKTYAIYAQYNGFKVSNKIVVKPTIITKNINVKKSKQIKFTAKLVNSNGKILKGKKIKFKFKGKTYKVKTNKKGIAILKINKKYKVGKYTIATSYAGLTVKNTIKIKN